ncbi:hypothetical protein B0H21DRAFT_691376 [Amylocystis lapponica]|nr:hypothetical protein B0H21DRAFT_691376 [Amylocystis lapponica]
MVSADNLNLDCLELIFAYLYGNDLVSVSLVSRSFLAGIIPRLYRSLVFKLNQAKRYPAVMSPFASVLAHPSLSVHVRHIDIRMAPFVKSSFHSGFMSDCVRTIVSCQNLSSFTCTPNLLPSFLLALQGKECLKHLRVNATLTPDQAKEFVKVKGLQSLTLDSGTWSIVDMLPQWMFSLGPTLTSLTLHSIHELSESILDLALYNLPHLTGLHIVNCSKIDHSAIFHLITHTPQLESLSFTSWESPKPLPSSVPFLPRLANLAVDTHCALSPTSTPTLWNSIIALTRSWSCPLRSITLRLSDKLLIGDVFIKDLLDAHATTLTHIALLNCALSLEGVRMMSKRCAELERFAISIPTKDVYGFADALRHSKTLHTLSDVTDAHTSHGPHVSITRPDVSTIIELVPNLRTIITDGRVWTASIVLSELVPHR